MINKVFLKKIFLSVLIVSIVSFGLTGCLDFGDIHTDHQHEDTGTVYLVVSGENHYDLYSDGYCYFTNIPAGTYSLINVPYGNHTFYAMSIPGANCYEYYSTNKKISGVSTYVYLDLLPDISTVYVIVTGNHSYEIMMDGVGKYYNVLQGTYTIESVPTGKNHTFEVVDMRGASYGHASTTAYISKCEHKYYFNFQDSN